MRSNYTLTDEEVTVAFVFYTLTMAAQEHKPSLIIPARVVSALEKRILSFSIADIITLQDEAEARIHELDDDDLWRQWDEHFGRTYH